jgi:hypothetical protein
MEVPEWQLFGEEWKPHGDAHLLEGYGFYIGGWAIDRNLFMGALTPKELVGAKEITDPAKCPEGYDHCRIAETCVKLRDYTVIGNRDKDRTPVRDATTMNANGWMVMLPHPTLIDYPLVQRGLWLPHEFAVNYARDMAGRMRIFSFYLAPAMALLNLLMLLLSRGVDAPAIIARQPLQAPVEIMLELFRSNRDAVDHGVFWLLFITPVLPVAAYNYIGEPEIFGLLLNGYIVASLFLFYCMAARMKRPPPAPKPEPGFPL